MNKTDLPGVRFHHFVRDDNGRLVATIATLALDKDMVRVAASVVHKNDTPNKKLGRTIALGRLFEEARPARIDATPWVPPYVELTRIQLASEIRSRDLLQHFMPDYKWKKLGKLRPAAPWTPEREAEKTAREERKRALAA